MSSAVTPPAPNLQKDEVTGEMVTKSELKRRQKQRAQEARKKEREVVVQANAPAGEAAPALSDLTPNVRYLFSRIELC